MGGLAIWRAVWAILEGGCDYILGAFANFSKQAPTVENMNPQRRDYSGSFLINSYVYRLINMLILAHYEFSDLQRRDYLVQVIRG